jgi:kynurenine formamidase
MPAADGLPTYAELSARTDAPKGSNWGIFGKDDQLGTINFLTPERVRAARECIRKGVTFGLNWRIDLPDPPLFGREPHQHTVFEIEAGFALDDRLDRFYPQRSSQWDSLAHAGHPRHGFYNFATADQCKRGERNGIEHMARRGIAGRGVLLDVARYQERKGAPIDPRSDFRITVPLLEEVASAERVEIRPGDILLIRTGWMAGYLALDAAGRAAVQQEMRFPGLDASIAMAGWLWDHRIAAVASDSPAVEYNPIDPNTGWLHARALAYLGMPFGEMWDLEALAADCAADGTYECFLASEPLHVPGGIGSPPNAVAIK